jgi:hypothetical protein
MSDIKLFRTGAVVRQLATGSAELEKALIIEYKRILSESVINQGLYYLDWLMDHKAEFELVVQKKLGSDAAGSIDCQEPSRASDARTSKGALARRPMWQQFRANGAMLRWRLLWRAPMSCPACGGTDREPLAPGYWECCTPVPQVEVVHQQVDRDVIIPVQHQVWTSCGHRYQEGPPVMADDAPMCECNTWAIGLCADCKAPVCGDHSSLVSDRRLCRTCAHEAARPARDAAESAESTARSARQEYQRTSNSGPPMGPDELAGWMQGDQNQDVWQGHRLGDC